MHRPDRRAIVAAALGLSWALLSPLNALACGGATAGVASGGGQATSLNLFGGGAPIYVALGSSVLLMAAAVLVIAMILTLRVRPPQVALIAQLSADGSAWWDGMSWHQSVFDAPPPPVRSADGRYWWDGRKWRPLPPPKASG